MTPSRRDDARVSSGKAFTFKWSTRLSQSLKSAYKYNRQLMDTKASSGISKFNCMAARRMTEFMVG